MRILVTGGAGFIGSAVCRHLIQRTNAEVVNVDKLTYAGNPNSLKTIDDDRRYRFVRADICDETRISELFAESVLAPTRCSRPRVAIGRACPTKQRAVSASCMSPPTKFMVRLEWMDFSPNRRPTIHHRLIQRRKLHRIIWPWHGIVPMAFQLSFRTARITTDRTIFLRN